MPTRQGAKSIDHVISNLHTKRIFITDVLPCPTVSDFDTLYITLITLRILAKSLQTRFKYIRI